MDDFRGPADSLDASQRRLVAQSDALTELTTRYTNPGERFGDRLRSILEISARALHVERLSMWEFDDQHTLIRCVGLYHRTGERYYNQAHMLEAGRRYAKSLLDLLAEPKAQR